MIDVEDYRSRKVKAKRVAVNSLLQVAPSFAGSHDEVRRLAVLHCLYDRRQPVPKAQLNIRQHLQWLKRCGLHVVNRMVEQAREE